MRFSDIQKMTSDGSWQVDFSLSRFVKFIESEIKENGLQLNPDFQRGHVWNEMQQIRWLEFLLRGGKTSNIIYLNCPSWYSPVKEGEYNDYVCVDGLQRLTAIRRFINNEIPVFDAYYNEFTDREPSASIKVNMNDLKTRKEVLQWYIDMNEGGTPHSESEIKRVKDLMRGC